MNKTRGVESAVNIQNKGQVAAQNLQDPNLVDWLAEDTGPFCLFENPSVC